MPYVNVKVAGALSDEQKRKISQSFTAILEEVAGKNPKSTYIVFEEVERNNWSVGGELLSD